MVYDCILPFCDVLLLVSFCMHFMCLTCVYDYELYWYYGSNVCIFYCIRPIFFK